MPLSGYFDGWRSKEWICPTCEWQGPGAQLAVEPFDALFEVHCPNCHHKFGLFTYPSVAEVLDEARKGNSEAVRMVEALGTRESYADVRARSLAALSQLPPIAGADLEFILSTEGGTDWMNPDWLVVRCGEYEIHREPSGYEWWEPIITIAEALLTTYAGRVKVIDAHDAMSALAGDDFQCRSTVRDFHISKGVWRDEA